MPPCAPQPISDRVPAFLSLISTSALPTPLAMVAPCCFVKHTTFFPTGELFPVCHILSSPLLILSSFTSSKKKGLLFHLI